MLNKTNIKIPEKYEDMIDLVWKDSDGYFAVLNENYHLDKFMCKSIHEYTQKSFLARLSQIKKD